MDRKLVQDVNDFVADSGMTVSEAGSFLCNDTKFVTDLRGGRDPRESTIVAVRQRIEAWRERHGEEAPAAAGN